VIFTGGGDGCWAYATVPVNAKIQIKRLTSTIFLFPDYWEKQIVTGVESRPACAVNAREAACSTSRNAAWIW
jgi:hypothetical protein